MSSTKASFGASNAVASNSSLRPGNLRLLEAKASPTPFTLPSLPCRRLHFILEARQDCQLPTYLGSTLRGAFGHALRKIACTGCKAARGCGWEVEPSCAYGRLFDVAIQGEPPPMLRGVKTAPLPYVFSPHTEGGQFAAGGRLAFDLVLVGRAAQCEPFVLAAVERMAAVGLGGRRHPFQLIRAEALAATRPAATLHDRALLRFLTPTRLSKKGQAIDPQNFPDLVLRMLRRHLELAHFYGPEGAPSWQFRPLLEHAFAVGIVRSNITWRDWRRYSNRQGRTLCLHAFTGEIEIAGDLQPLAPLLHSAQDLHVGKSTTFGLGKLQVQPL